MLSLSAVQKELENENLSPTLRKLCQSFLKERTLYWKKFESNSYRLICQNNSSVADIAIPYHGDPYYATINNKCTKKFASLSEAIQFLTSSFQEMDFIVTPPDFEI